MASDVLPGAEIRENLVTTAIKFLTNPNVQRCTLDSKERFLRSKGLTDLEIQKAIERCGDLLDVSSVAQDMIFFQCSKRSWFKDNVLPLIVYGGFAYGCYWFYKHYIRQMLFTEQPRRRSTAECIDELRKSLDVLNSSVSTLRGELQVSSQQTLMRSELDHIKSDITSVKGILLNRNQFPSLKGRPEPPSIPAWQRHAAGEAAAAGAGDQPPPADDKKKAPRARTARSESGGSNSSEGEQAAKNSDSSLEIIT